MLYEPERLRQLSTELENESPEEILIQALELAPNITFACSFGAEDMVLLDMLMKIQPAAHVFYLDTDVLFPETYKLVETAVHRYGIPNLRRVSTDLTIAEQARQYGDELWRTDPNLCCNLRKVRPLERHLRGYDAWITGIRREQAPTRAKAQVFEWDGKFELIKVNPLVKWTIADVWHYLRSNKVPYNPLHDQNYPSIGCRHCTLPVAPGADPRSGRWAGFAKTECGLHK
jgi:phosphoadenosine phosphosulfate reductase